MAAMWLFMNWGQTYKKSLEALGLPVSKPQLALIILIDWLVNYWYVPAVVLLFVCLAVSGGKPAAPRRED